MELAQLVMTKEASIEGIPFITRFKTFDLSGEEAKPVMRIEGIPFITRFKTTSNSRRSVASAGKY